MLTIRCYQCSTELDTPTREVAIREAHRHAQSHGHNVGVYRAQEETSGKARELVAIVLKWTRKAA